MVAISRPGSAPCTPVKALRSISVPSVALSGVKEWPVPGTRTGPWACRTAAARSTSSLGLTIWRGLQVTPPDQFDHLPATIFTADPVSILRRLCIDGVFEVNIDRRRGGGKP